MGSSWLDKQPSIETVEERLSWAIARLKKITELTAYAKGKSATFDTLHEECETLITELETGKVVDRGIG